MPLPQFPQLSWIARFVRKPVPAAAACTCSRVDTPLAAWTSLPARPRLPLALVRVLGAQCPLCDGLGCEECARTGLR